MYVTKIYTRGTFYVAIHALNRKIQAQLIETFGRHFQMPIVVPKPSVDQKAPLWGKTVPQANLGSDWETV